MSAACPEKTRIHDTMMKEDPTVQQLIKDNEVISVPK